MAKKKTNKENTFIPDLEMLTHKYSDFYEGYMLYDSRIINYPVYKTKIDYLVKKEQELHTIVLGILKIIDYLKTIKTNNRYEFLLKITQMDNDILSGILADLGIKGYLKQEKELALTSKGEQALKKEKEEIIEEHTSYIIIDGVFGSSESEKNNSTALIHKIDKDSFELKPNFKARPRIECLDEKFEGDKTLRQNIIEALIVDSEEEFHIEEIIKVAPNKLFKQYFCLFYKNKKEEEKILVIDRANEIDKEATKLFDKLLDTQKFAEYSITKSKSFNENKTKFEQATPEKIGEFTCNEIDLTDGKTIEVMEHKRYFKYVLNHAKKEIYIQSPWVRNEVLEKYKKDIENATKRGIKIIIKYGMKPRNRFDKQSIDEKSLAFFKTLDKKFFKYIRRDDHSKIVICDDDFMIMGSFNWLSFGGGKEGEKVRGETSTINKNKDEIKKQKLKFEE